MGITERKQRQKESVKAAILEAARNLTKDLGWQALSIRKISESIEYSIPVIYDHFENKEAILFEFIKEGFNTLSESLRAATKGKKKPEKELEALAFAYWDFAFDHRNDYQLMYGLGIPTCEQARATPEIMGFTSQILSAIERLIEASHSKSDGYLKMQTFLSMMHGFVSINLTHPTDPGVDPQQDKKNRMVLQDFITSFVNGIIQH